MLRFITGAFFHLLTRAASAPLPARVRPIIGILSIPPSAAVDDLNYSRIDSSYVRWLQAAGAYVTPILFNETAENIEKQFHKLSGVLLTGGPNKPTDFNRYFAAANQLYQLSLRYEMPLWGTCLGFQSISDIIAGGLDILSNYEATSMELPLQLSNYARGSSRMFSGASAEIIALFTENNYTTNWHHYGVSPETFDSILFPAGMRMLSMNVDENNLPFVSTMEHVSAPIYATQWHPEANAHDREHSIVNHYWNAVQAMQYLAGFFVQEARVKGLGVGDIGMDECKCVADIDMYPLKWYFGSHSLQFEFSQ